MYTYTLSLKSLTILLCLSCLQGVLYALPAQTASLGLTKADLPLIIEKEKEEAGKLKREATFLQQIFGAEFEALTFEEAQVLGLKGGVMIKKITSGPLSQQSFMKEGFIITKINGEEVFTIRRLYNVLKKNPNRMRFEGKYNDLLTTYDSFSGNYTYLLTLNEQW